MAQKLNLGIIALDPTINSKAFTIIAHALGKGNAFNELERLWALEQVGLNRRLNIVLLDECNRPIRIKGTIQNPQRIDVKQPKGFKPRGFPFKHAPTHVLFTDFGHVNTRILLQYSNSSNAAFKAMKVLWEIYSREKDTDIWVESLT